MSMFLVKNTSAALPLGFVVTRRAFFISLTVVCTLFTANGGFAQNAQEIPPGEKVLIEFDGPIGSFLEQFVISKLAEAKRLGADVVIIQIDSPGGLVEESFAVAEALRDADWARTVAFIPREAISGAAFVALGCDEILMAPKARLGDAGPIFLDPDFQFRHAPEKFRSYVVQRIRTLAEAKNRPAALAEAMVDMDLVVYEVKNRKTGQKAFMTDDEIKDSPEPDQWEKGKPVFESRKEHFLQVEGDRAVELGLADAIAANRAEMCRRLGFEEQQLVVFAPTLADHAAHVLNYPIITGLLFVIGLVGLYIEFSSPGVGVGGLMAVLCFGIFFWSHFLGGMVGWLEIVLFLAGTAFVVVEIFVIPGFGVTGLSGILLILASLFMACQTSLIPKTPAQWQSFSVTLQTLFVAGVVFLIIAFFLNSRLRMIPVLNRIMLPPPGLDGRTDAERAAMAQTARVDGESGAAQKSLPLSLGDRGIALSLLRPAGKADFGNRRIDVVADGDFINKGETVEIVEISGNRVVVIAAIRRN